MLDYGLALSGGGTRGAAHVGILRALEEEGLLPNRIGGTSAGSIVAGLYAAGMKIGDMRDLVLYLSKNGKWYLDPDICGLISCLPQAFLKRKVTINGLLKGNRLLSFLCELTEGKYLSDVKHDLLIPTVDIKSGDTVVFTNMKSVFSDDLPIKKEHVRWENDGPLCQIMMASSSVPAIFSPRRIGDFCLVDGGVSDNLPVDLMIAAGEPHVVAVDIGIDYSMPDDDSIVEVVSHSFSLMSRDLKDCKSSGEIFLLRPELKKGAGLLSFDCMESCMEDGYLYGKKMMPRIRRTLETYGINTSL